MGWKIVKDITKETPFFEDMVSRLNGRNDKKRYMNKSYPEYQVTCPKCNRRVARLGASKSGDGYMLICPCDGCNCGMSLNNLIQKTRDKDLIKKWTKSRMKTWYEPNGWLPIKNRKPKKS